MEFPKGTEQLTVFGGVVGIVNFNLLQSTPGVGLYHLAIKTGDERSAGTDANVWVQVYGDKGDTGHVQLKKSGMMENLFERGQTDYFTLEAGDVGKVSFDISLFCLISAVQLRKTKLIILWRNKGERSYVSGVRQGRSFLRNCVRIKLHDI